MSKITNENENKLELIKLTIEEQKKNQLISVLAELIQQYAETKKNK